MLKTMKSLGALFVLALTCPAAAQVPSSAGAEPAAAAVAEPAQPAEAAPASGSDASTPSAAGPTTEAAPASEGAMPFTSELAIGDTPRHDGLLHHGIFWTGSAVALAGLGVGVIFTVYATQAGSEADDLAATLPASGDSGADVCAAAPGTCGEINSHLAARDRDSTVAAVGFGVGALAAITTVAYWLAIDDGPSESALQLMPAVDPESASLLLRGHF